MSQFMEVWNWREADRARPEKAQFAGLVTSLREAREAFDRSLEKKLFVLWRSSSTLLWLDGDKWTYLTKKEGASFAKAHPKEPRETDIQMSDRWTRLEEKLERDFQFWIRVMSAMKPMSVKRRRDYDLAPSDPGMVAVVDGREWHLCRYSPGGGPEGATLYCPETEEALGLGERDDDYGIEYVQASDFGKGWKSA